MSFPIVLIFFCEDLSFKCFGFGGGACAMVCMEKSVNSLQCLLLLRFMGPVVKLGASLVGKPFTHCAILSAQFSHLKVFQK